jgi:hypothetical protein
MITPRRLRTLGLEVPTQPGRPAHVSAASGLVRSGGSLFVVADDENHLGVFSVTGDQAGTLVRIVDGTLPLEQKPRKKHKPDFESLVLLPPFAEHPHGALLALGSCSKPNRCRGIAMAMDSHGGLEAVYREIDLGPLRDALDTRFGRLNIEGAVVMGDELVLLQRGNKGDRRNARIRMRLGRVMHTIAGQGELGVDALLDIHEHDLGTVGDVPYGFSDATALPDGRMVFTAIAENTSDSYADGMCVGAAIGVLDPQGGIGLFEPLGGCPKVEGIEAIPEGEQLRVLLVTDADDADVPASLLETWLPAGRG